MSVITSIVVQDRLGKSLESNVIGAEAPGPVCTSSFAEPHMVP